MSEKRIGRQTPTLSVVNTYDKTDGDEAVEIYNSTGQTLMPYQEQAMYDILAIDEDGMYVHSTVGFQISRRNGKGEILAARELYGLQHNQNGLHTAHRADTSSDASKRLDALLKKKGYTECLRPRPDQEYPNQYSYAKQSGKEEITLLWGDRPTVSFRTRTNAGGLGQGYDYVIIDEAQEYTGDQATALAFITSAAPNPQTIMCGTPPTVVSKGDVFPEYRRKCLAGELENSLWFSWETPAWTDLNDKDAWYEYNPALGITITERAIKDEIAKTTPDDFNIQRFGLWLAYDQKSFITETQWKELEINKLPQTKGDLQVGIKFGKDGRNVSLAIGIKLIDERIYTEVIDCRPITAGYDWIINFLLNVEWQTVAIDGANGQRLADEMKDARIKKEPILMTVRNVIDANAQFVQGLGDETTESIYLHSCQPSVDAVATKCEKRLIGQNGGFGFKAIDEEGEISLLDSSIIAFWLAKNAKEKRKHTISY